MIIYNYSTNTKEFTESTKALKSPLEQNKYLIPLNSTTKKPLECKENEISCFIDNEWVLIKDYRDKKIYNVETKQEKIVDYVGDIEKGYTLLTPTKSTKWNKESNKWVFDYDTAANSIRKERENLLIILDFMVLNPIRYENYSNEYKEKLKKYRKSLLDVTKQEDFPNSVNWPIIPQEEF